MSRRVRAHGPDQRATRPGPVTVVQRPIPAVWQAALDLADGDVSRLHVVDDGNAVIVRNLPAPRSQRMETK